MSQAHNPEPFTTDICEDSFILGTFLENLNESFLQSTKKRDQKAVEKCQQKSETALTVVIE